MDTLVLASGNRDKYAEFLALLPRGMVGKLLFAPESLPHPQVEETGATYAMNAVLKARAWALSSGLPSLADDSGIEVEALGWRPGVRSARVVEGSDADRNRWLLSQMEGRENRYACFVAVVALSIPSPDGGLLWTLATEGVCEGRLAEHETGAGGFGYDPLFIPNGCDVSFAELPLAVKNQISHRAKALQNLLEQGRTPYD
ncbi:MAG: non-canonical purine NTP pyrophosphatase [Synergistaceae bacterium]|nr:non-canonical purine NTP pyrophosphatase [Synergistaceae bacterium]